MYNEPFRDLPILLIVLAVGAVLIIFFWTR